MTPRAAGRPRRFQDVLRPWIVGGGRRLVRLLPLGPETRSRLVLASYRNLGGLLRGLPQFERWRLAEERSHRVHEPLAGAALDNALQGLRFTPTQAPEVSVIIPCYGRLDYTVGCLDSIARHRPQVSFEIIVAEDASGDPEISRLASVPGLRFFENVENLGFLRSCNRAAQSARGTFLCFLNNDTEVADGWLDRMVELMCRVPDCGLVGSKLLFADGSLQEAGGVIWSDGTGWNFGRNDDPDRPEYNYVREVDYCSGASILLRRALFERLGGFDTRYAPAYFEDSDLAFSVRAAGLRVLYQPTSVVVHVEGVTSGTDANSGVKAFQVTNRHKFVEKWASRLRSHRPPGIDPWRERDRQAWLRVLVISDRTPEAPPGSPSMHILGALGCKVNFLPTDLAIVPDSTAVLQQAGIECLYQPYCLTPRDYLREHGSEIDLVVLEPIGHLASPHADIRKYCRRAKIVLSIVESREVDGDGTLRALHVMRDDGMPPGAALVEAARGVDGVVTSAQGLADRLHALRPDLLIHTVTCSARVPGLGPDRLEWSRLLQELGLGLPPDPGPT
jgi:GT2 family glycosyltransferase